MTEPKEPTVTREDIKELIDEFRPAMWDGRNVRIVAALRLALTTKDAEQQIATLTAERDRARKLVRDLDERVELCQCKECEQREQEIASWPTK